MIVICEDCGKSFQIDPASMKGKQARFNCEGCGHVVKVKRPDEASARSPVDARAMSSPDTVGTEPDKGAKAKKKKKKEKKESGPKRVGLRAKMILLFFLIPLLCIAASGWLFIQQLNRLSQIVTDESTAVVTEMAEETIKEIARSVAAEVAVYLSANPDLQKTRFNEDPVFREIAVQPVGETGYTALNELDSDGIWRTWGHENPAIIGIDMENLREPLGRSFPGFWRILTGVEGGKESDGYYTWRDADGEFRDKYMLCTPAKGTGYNVCATTYLYEFTRPMMDMALEAETQTRQTMRFLLAIIGGTLLLTGVIVFMYGHIVTQRVRSLTEAAEKISVGELDTEIDIKSNDEIGDLGESISRMQDSIQLSLDRLRRRR